MSRGQSNPGNSNSGQNRPNSGSSVGAPKVGQGFSGSSRPSALDESTSIDSNWDTPKAAETKPSEAKVSPKRVISIGPPADEPTRTTIDHNSAHPAEPSTSSRPAPGAVSLDGPKDSIGHFSALDIGTLVARVMGSQPPRSTPRENPVAPLAPTPAPPAPRVQASDSPAARPSSTTHQAKPVPSGSKAQASDSPAARPSSTTHQAKPVPSGSKAQASNSPAANPSSTAHSATSTPSVPVIVALPDADRAPPSGTEPQGPDSDWSRAFFSANSEVQVHGEDNEDLLLDERQLRSLAPEVRARRARYRVWVILVVIGLAALLGAAIALKHSGHH